MPRNIESSWSGVVFFRCIFWWVFILALVVRKVSLFASYLKKGPLEHTAHRQSRDDGKDAVSSASGALVVTCVSWHGQVHVQACSCTGQGPLLLRGTHCHQRASHTSPRKPIPKVIAAVWIVGDQEGGTEAGVTQHPTQDQGKPVEDFPTTTTW